MKVFVAMIGQYEERAPCGVFTTVELAERGIREHPAFDPAFDPDKLGTAKAADTGSRYDIVPFELDRVGFTFTGASKR